MAQGWSQEVINPRLKGPAMKKLLVCAAVCSALLVVPASLIGNWIRELTRIAPSLSFLSVLLAARVILTTK